MKGIEFNKHQLEAYKNGATMFLVPILREDIIYSRMCNYEDKGNTALITEKQMQKFLSKEEPFTKEESEKIAKEGSENLVKYAASLQKGDEFFIQYDREREVSRGYSSFGIELKSKVKYPANQMTEKESEFKDVVLDVEVKRVRDITHDEIYNIYPDAHTDGYQNFMHGFNDKFCEGKYTNNPYVLLYTIKGV